MLQNDDVFYSAPLSFLSMLSFAYSTNVEKYISKSQLKSGLQYKMFITANRQKKGSGNYNAWFDKVVLWFWVF